VLLCAQGLTHARITFKNEASGEYTFYEVKLTSTAPAPMGRLTLECPVRNQTSTTVSITNPLDVPVTLKPSISSKQVRVGRALHQSQSRAYMAQSSRRGSQRIS
jgi:hypothetical protein